MVKCIECRLLESDEIITKSGRQVRIRLCINARGHGIEEVVDPNTEKECHFFDKLDV